MVQRTELNLVSRYSPTRRGRAQICDDADCKDADCHSAVQAKLVDLSGRVVDWEREIGEAPGTSTTHAVGPAGPSEMRATSGDRQLRTLQARQDGLPASADDVSALGKLSKPGRSSFVLNDPAGSASELPLALMRQADGRRVLPRCYVSSPSSRNPEQIRRRAPELSTHAMSARRLRWRRLMLVSRRAWPDGWERRRTSPCLE